jgi:hypothetical protein
MAKVGQMDEGGMLNRQRLTCKVAGYNDRYFKDLGSGMAGVNPQES